MLDTLTSTFAPVHREGWPFVAAAAFIALVLYLFVSRNLGWVAIILAVWCAYFFRDPDRVTPLRPGLVISPADGRISAIEELVPPAELDLGGEKRIRISIFMNVFDVHVNRAPVPGRIARITYIPGKFLNADLDKASRDNERQALIIDTGEGVRIGVVQIAGLLARRIVRFVDEGQSLAVGQRFGLIRFGSRVDVYLPAGHHALVAIGQRAIAGETVIADLHSKESEREARRG